VSNFSFSFFIFHSFALVLCDSEKVSTFAPKITDSDMKKNIAIVYGGDSSEKEISALSAATVAQHLPADKYCVFPVRISGRDWTAEINGYTRDVNRDDFSIGSGDEKTTFDCAFIIIHGAPGENGILQSYFDLLGLSYTTCNAFVSALTFNKYACKCYLRDLDVALAPDLLLRPNDTLDSEAIERRICYPMFVKPNASGSSCGVAKVNTPAELLHAIVAAQRESPEILVEACISGIELSHGIYSTSQRTLELPVTQIVSEREFFDYTAKYEGKSREITPAPIAPDLADRVRTLTRKISRYLACHGLVRVDYIYANDQLYFLEINTVPGMSGESIIPQQIRSAGYTLAQVLDWLIEDSLSKY
jgi:D-alanine-D-alanine ligase